MTAVFPSPVALVLTAHRDARHAFATSRFSEVAHHPTTLWVSIPTETPAHADVSATGRFALAVLHDGQAALALSPDAGRLPLFQAEDGLWYLEGALANMSCQVRRRVELPGHTLFIADIQRGMNDTETVGRRHLLTTDLPRVERGR